MLVSIGERESISLMSIAINSIKPGLAQSFTGSQIGLITDCNHQNARILEIKGEIPNIDDVIYFLESQQYLTIKHDSKGKITGFIVKQRDIEEWTNKDVSSLMLFEWNRHLYKNISNKILDLKNR